ncbi:MAG TPA: sensor domain-containing diguanylate cyclase [Blastocatellia bacterium]|nr:sensor domain-containing diguanylate cyclase [Blastocatellia bacterium]
MYSLFYVLSNQHGEEFAPVRCNEQTITRLVRYFEDVVTENKLSALVMEGRCPKGDQARERERMGKLASVARRLYLFSCDSACKDRSWNPEASSRLTLLEEPDYHGLETGPFILVMDQRFCGLLASYALAEEENNRARTYEMLWTFDPNAVFTAIEYLMARINAQKPDERSRFGSVLNSSTPHSVSLRLTLSLTRKLTLLMQRQNELEMAINRISSAISSTLELEPMLQKAVEEVGWALEARRAALVLWQEGTSKPESMSVYERSEEPEPEQPEKSEQPFQPSDNGQSPAKRTAETLQMPGPLEIPITYRNSVIGVLTVEDDTPGRVWEDEEVLMARTVSDQLAIGISHARLFDQVRTQAMTDSLTGLHNHRCFQDRLDREIKLADRNNDQVSLILLDLDHLKRINDTHGHRSGDSALCHVAKVMRSSVREVDICARYGGEEFVVILPQCGREDAIMVAERLREAIASSILPNIGQITASLGVASYPAAAKSKDELIEMADRAMYLAKAAGRNRVRTLMHHQYSSLNG